MTHDIVAKHKAALDQPAEGGEVVDWDQSRYTSNHRLPAREGANQMKTITFDETKWKLVPVELTSEMLLAVREEMGWCNPVGIFRKMLAAAPRRPRTARRWWGADCRSPCKLE